MKKRVLIYTDDGAGDFSVFSARRYFADHDIAGCRADAVIDGTALQQCDLFVMPGGADLPYCRTLDGAGNRHIRAFIEKGGTYLGICAGAYYGAREIAYHAGRADEIKGPRELALIDALAYGSLPDLAGYYDETLKTAAWVNLAGPSGQTSAFYHGGCTFAVDDPDARVLARFADLPGQPPAILEKTVGKGRVLLSGVHCEVRPDHLTGWTWNGAADTAAALALSKRLASTPLYSLASRLF